MDETLEGFFHDFRQEMLADAEANSTYQLESFMESVSRELIETGFVEGYEHCHYRAPRGMRVDGYWFNDEGALDLFVTDFDCRRSLETLTQTEVGQLFKRLVNFFEASLDRTLEPDVTTPEYGLVRQVADRRAMIRQVNFYLASERVLSDRFEAIPEGNFGSIRATYHIWDIARFQRQRSSRGRKEPLDIDFVEMFGHGISCLPANLGSETYQSFLIVIPATILAALYDRYSARLLEQNVRTFLQARAQVNKGIRATILNEPHMFFAYNNGITATAQHVETVNSAAGLQIVRMTDLQIVNGGQTTASLFHTMRRDKADLSAIFVQMKLSVIDSEESEAIVPRISEYANTQNRVNAADFFSNHPFHVRMAEFSRRIWAPPQQGAPRETKWFYERTRGQYLDAQAKQTPGEQKRFKAEYPKSQMFTKTDLAKFENVCDDHPRWVNLGSQKNFARYAARIGREWEKGSDGFNEFYFKRAIARAILFRTTEAMVSAQPWYNGGHRANIVAYTLSMAGEITGRRGLTLPYLRIWNSQAVDDTLAEALSIISTEVDNNITAPPQGISDVSEWAKKEGCWTRLQAEADRVAALLPEEFWVGLPTPDDQQSDQKEARKVQKVDNGIEIQKQIFEVPKAHWSHILKVGTTRKFLTPKESDILRIAEQIPLKIPTDRQSIILAGNPRQGPDGRHTPSRVSGLFGISLLATRCSSIPGRQHVNPFSRSERQLWEISMAAGTAVLGAQSRPCRPVVRRRLCYAPMSFSASLCLPLLLPLLGLTNLIFGDFLLPLLNGA